MKLFIIGAIILLSLVLFLIRRFRNQAAGYTRIYFTLFIAGVLVALGFGPPKYVLLEDTLSVYQIEGKSVKAYQGWELNRLFPTEAFAVSVFYLPETDTAISHEQAGYRPLQAGFSVPGNIFSRYLWLILLFSAVFCVICLGAVRKHRNTGKRFQEAVSAGTIHALDQFIDSYGKGLFRSRRFLKEAIKQKNEVCNRYIRRILLINSVNEKKANALKKYISGQEISDEEKKRLFTSIKRRENHAKLLEIIVDAIRHVRDSGTYDFTHSISVEPGIYNKYFLQKFDSPRALLESTLKTNQQFWNRSAEIVGLPEIEDFREQFKLNPKVFSSFDNNTIKQLRKTIEVGMTSLLKNPETLNYREWNALIDNAVNYLFVSYMLSLPLEKKWDKYIEIYKSSINKILLEALSRLVPDEINSEGRPAIFQSPTKRSFGREIVVKLAYSGSVTPEGQILCDQCFSFLQGGQLIVNRVGQRAEISKASETARPILDAVSSCANAFRFPELGRARLQGAATAEVSTLRAALKEIDDLISEYAKETAKEEFKGYVYDQLPEEFEAVVETLNFVIETQMNSMVETGVELATSLLEVLLSTGESD